jgi:hypothetical protein
MLYCYNVGRLDKVKAHIKGKDIRGMRLDEGIS